MKCPFCNNENTEQEKYCTNCGAKLKTKHTTQYKYYKNVIIGSLITCLIISGLFLNDLKRASNTSQTNNETELGTNDFKFNEKEILGEYLNNDAITEVSNRIKGGIVTSNHSNVYMINNQHNVVKMDGNLANQEVIYEGKCSAIVVYENYLYIKDDNKQGHIIEYNLDTQTYNEIIQTDAYYAFRNNDQLFYQNDPDNESIYYYDLISQENIKLNDEPSYNLQLNQNYLYFSTEDAIKKIDLNSLEIINVLSKSVFNVVVTDEYIYYVDQADGCLYRFNEQEQTVKRLNKEITREFVLTDQDIYYVNSDYALITMRLDGSENQWVNSTIQGYSIAVLKDYILYFDLNDFVWYQVDLNGRFQKTVFSQLNNNNFI